MDEPLTGSAAERHLLGAVILDSRQFRFAEGLVSSADFEDGRLGDVWEGIGQMVVRGVPVDQITVGTKIREVAPSLPLGVEFEWAGADVTTYAVKEYARTVRADSVRRSLLAMAASINEQVRAGGEPVDVASAAIGQLSGVVDGASSGLLQTKTLGEVLAGSDEYDWLVPDLLERRDRLVITGAEGAGKTTFVRQLAVLSASGIDPLRFNRIEPVRVLVVDAENTERQWRRAVRYVAEVAGRKGSRDPSAAINMVAGTRIDITKGSHLGEIHRLIDRHRPDMVFIGPLYKLVPRAINSDDDAAPLIVGLDSLRERGVALVMEAHAGHATTLGGERDLRPRGSSALLGWPEFGFGLRPLADDPDMVSVVRWRGDRDQRAWPKHMRRGNRAAGEPWPWVPSEV